MGQAPQFLPVGGIVGMGGRCYISTGLTVSEINTVEDDYLETLWRNAGFVSRPPLTNVTGSDVTYWLVDGRHGLSPAICGETFIPAETETEPEPEPEPEPDLPPVEIPGPYDPDFLPTPAGERAQARIEALEREIRERDERWRVSFEQLEMARRQDISDARKEREPIQVKIEQDSGPGGGLLSVANADITPVIDFVVGQLSADEDGRDHFLFPDGVGDLLDDLARTLRLPGPVTIPSFKTRVSGWVAGKLTPILNIANVDRSASVNGAEPGTIEYEQRVFDQDKDRAINGAVLATNLVIALNVAAAMADGGTQLFSLGQIEGFQQLVQNIIWATGLSDIGGLSFRPQVAASFAPLLERHWQSESQAQIPGASELQRYLVREIFDPTRRAELLGNEDLTALKGFMRQRGFSDYWTENAWAAHWQLMSQNQLDEALHRGVIDKQTWQRQVRFNDVVPESMPWLEQIIYKPFTRVDVRRMENLGVLTPQQTLQAYADVGYYAPTEPTGGGRQAAQFVSQSEFDPTVHKAQAMVVFTDVFNALPSIRRRLSKGWLAPEDVLKELTDTGMPLTNAERLMEGLVKAEDLDGAEATRELTTAQIVRGTKLGIISFDQGKFLLKDLGWRDDRAEFMLRLQVTPEDAPGITELGQRLITGLPGRPDVRFEEMEG